MKKLFVLLFVVVIAFSLVAVAQTAAQSDKVPGVSKATKKTPALIQYDGTMVRFNADKNTIDLSKGNREKTVVFDEKTEWIVDGKAVTTKEEFTIGKRLVAHGTMDESGRIMATKIVLHRTK